MGPKISKEARARVKREFTKNRNKFLTFQFQFAFIQLDEKIKNSVQKYSDKNY